MNKKRTKKQNMSCQSLTQKLFCMGEIACPQDENAIDACTMSFQLAVLEYHAVLGQWHSGSKLNCDPFFRFFSALVLLVYFCFTFWPKHPLCSSLHGKLHCCSCFFPGWCCLFSLRLAFLRPFMLNLMQFSYNSATHRIFLSILLVDFVSHPFALFKCELSVFVRPRLGVFRHILRKKGWALLWTHKTTIPQKQSRFWRTTKPNKNNGFLVHIYRLRSSAFNAQNFQRVSLWTSSIERSKKQSKRVFHLSEKVFCNKDVFWNPDFLSGNVAKWLSLQVCLSQCQNRQICRSCRLA